MRRELEACLHQQFLQERVADLHRRPPLLAILSERRRCERGALDAVAPRRRPDEEQDVARPGRPRQGDVVVARDADAHGVDDRVARVGGIEADLAADVGDADAVAVARDPPDHAAEEVAVAGGFGLVGHVIGVERAEAEAVEQGDRPRAHGEDVANDAADTRRRALVGLDRARMVV